LIRIENDTELFYKGNTDLDAIVHYEGHETKVRKLTQAELHDVFQDGLDLFTNSESFV
jgi:hypothetical protein